MLTIAVTGATGFVGRHVLEELCKCEVQVVAITRDAKRLSVMCPRARVVEMDISHAVPDNYNRMGRPDVLIHLAWDGLPNYKSLHHYETELPNQYLFLKSLIEAGLPSLMVTGTCFEYGMQSGCLTEEMVTKPANPYGYAKNALHQQLQFLRSVCPFNFLWGRLFYMYGDSQPANSLYSQLKKAVLTGERIFKMSAGEQLRDYLPAAQVARNIIQLTVPNFISGTVNICSGYPISVRRLVEKWLIANNWQIALDLGHYPYPDHEPLAFWGDRSRLGSILEVQ
jgi:nucleoside-diphosphate-sugar epimerase